MADCCVIIPCYNESGRILKEEFVTFASANPWCHFLFVNDGSTDDTLDSLNQLGQLQPRMTVLSLPQNRGKAEAVRVGMLAALNDARFHYFAYLDADLAIPLEEFKRIFDLTLQQPNLEFTYLAKIPRKDAEVSQPMKRFLMGRSLALLTRMSLRLPIYDTQCGCKVMIRKVAHLVFEAPFISPWLFDIELFHRLLRSCGRGYFAAHTLQVPLDKLEDRGSSHVKGRDIFKLPFEFWTIHRTYRRP